MSKLAILMREDVSHVHGDGKWITPNGLYRLVPALKTTYGTVKFIVAVPKGCSYSGIENAVAMRIVDEEGRPWGYDKTLVSGCRTVREAFAKLGYETEGDLT